MRAIYDHSQREVFMNATLRLGFCVVVALVAGCAPSFKIGGTEKGSLLRGPAPWDRASKALPVAAGAASPESPIRALECPSLFVLVDQVLPERAPALLADREQVFRTDYLKTATAAGVPGSASVSRYFPEISEEKNPLPEELASLSFTKAAVELMVAAYRREAVGPARKVSARDVRIFTKAFFSANLAPYRGDGAPRRLKRLRTFTDQRKATWEGIAHTYFTAYYRNQFVDRTGGALGRPTIGLKITNETITGALSVALESISDYVILACEKIKDPVIFEMKDSKESWQTAENRKPTLVTVTQHLLGTDGSQPTKEFLRVVERVKPDAPGISKEKLAHIRLVSGYASDLASAVADLITRSIGGGGVSLGLFGKVSIGDNDTLAKLLQTGIGWLFARTTEMSVATFRCGMGQGRPVFASGAGPGPGQNAPILVDDDGVLGRW